MKQFPEFIRSQANRVANLPIGAMTGFVFDGADDIQIVFWTCQEGGTQPEDSHDFWEYCLVVEGTYDGMVGGKPVHLEPGDECAIPPGVKHSGRYSPGYRAIDAFGGKRVHRMNPDK